MEERRSETIILSITLLGELIANRQPVLRPRPVEERDEAMVEQIQKVGKRVGVSTGGILIVPGKDTLGAHQPHKVHGHPWRPTGLGLQGLNLRGGKFERAMSEEAHRFSRRRRRAAHRQSSFVAEREQAHRLKEIEGPRPLEEFLDYRRICSPAREFHRRKSSLR